MAATSPSHQFRSTRVRSRSLLASAAALASAIATHAQTTTLWSSVSFAPNTGGAAWDPDHDQQAVLPPDCANFGNCNTCNTTTLPFARQIDPDTGNTNRSYLIGRAFRVYAGDNRTATPTNWSLPAGHRITDIRLNVVGRYREGTASARLAYRFVLPGVFDQGDFLSVAESYDTDCEFMLSSGDGSVPAVYNVHDQNVVRNLEVWIRRGPTETTGLRIKAFRLQVTTACDICPPTLSPSQTVCEGQSASFTAFPCGADPFTYIWWRDDVQINPADPRYSGANAQTLTIFNTTPADHNARFTCTVSNPCDSRPSDIAGTRLFVVPAPAPSPNPPAPVCAGSTITLTASAPNSTSVQWSGGAGSFNPPNALNTIYTPGPTETGNVTLTLTAFGNAPCSARSASVLATIHPRPAAPTNPIAAPATINPGQQSCLSAAVPPGHVVDWFSGSCGGTPVSPCVSPAVTTTYYGRARNTSTGCTSVPCAQVTVTVTPADPTGACCRSDCTCSSTTEAQCNGRWFANQACAVPPCDPCQSCCIDSTTCILRTVGNCAGVAVPGPCSANPCPGVCGFTPPPANDFCTSALPLSLSQPRSVNTACSTGSVAGCGNSNDVWYSFQAPYTDIYSFSMSGLAGNGTLAAFPNCIATTPLVCSNTCATGSLPTLGSLMFTGESVLIRVANCSPAFNILTVRVDPTSEVSGACCRSTTCDVSTTAACVGPNTRFTGIGVACNSGSNNRSPCCRCDINQNGSASVQDIFDFLSCYFNGSFTRDCNADFNDSGNISVQDIFDFLAAYFAGCH